MCGYNIFNKLLGCIDEINYHTKKRGPDLTNIENINNITFIHNLLDITGKQTKQPFKKNNIVCIFNGEIYNYKTFGDYESDGYCLIDLYEKYGINFTKYLDGEFSISLIDFNKNIILLSTDIFSTKPLFYSFNNNVFMISSYHICIQKNCIKKYKQLDANKTIIFDLKTFEKIEETNIHNFDLKQYKNTFNDWNNVIESLINNI